MIYAKFYCSIIHLILLLTLSLASDEYLAIPDWDYLMYTQRWPISACISWEQENSGHRCNLPADLSQWVVHGVWPTKTGTDGPNKCDSAVHFDPDQLQPLHDDLVNRWTNIEASTKENSFWKHEWDKHGTCAVILPELNSVYNYFNQGLEWNRQYNITSILEQGSIYPKNSGYAVKDIYNAIKSVLGKNPSIHCEIDRKADQPMISEIHICFNKSLDLIDCSPSMTTDCSQKKEVLYLPSLPQFSPDDFTDYGMDYGEDEDIMLESQRWYERGRSLLNFYRFIRVLMWFTL